MEQIIKDGHDLRPIVEELILKIKKEQNRTEREKLEAERDRKLLVFLKKFGDDDIKSWIVNGFNDETPILFAEFLGHYLVAKNLSTSQIRNVFGEVKRMEMSSQSGIIPYGQFLLLKPRLTYATERKGTDGSRAFKQWMIPAIDAVINGKTDAEKKVRFDYFSNFFEAILAYHRAFGGK